MRWARKLVGSLRRGFYVFTMAEPIAFNLRIPDYDPRVKSARTRVENSSRQIIEAVHGWLENFSTKQELYRLRTPEGNIWCETWNRAEIERIKKNQPRQLGPIEVQRRWTYRFASDWEPKED